MLAQVAFMFLLWAAFRRLSLQRILISGFVNGVGALVAWLPVALYFCWHNAFGEFIEASWTYNIYYGAASQTTIFFVTRNALSRLQLLSSLVVCMIAGLMLHVGLWAMSRRNREPEDKIGQAPYFWWPLALLWFAFDLAGALAGGRNYAHYFLPLAASLSVVAGVTYWSLAREHSELGTLVGYRQGPLFPHRRPPHLCSGVRCPTDELCPIFRCAPRSSARAGSCEPI